MKRLGLILIAFLHTSGANAAIVTIGADFVGYGFNDGQPNPASNFAGSGSGTLIAGEGDSTNYFQGFAFIDISSFHAQIAAASSIDFRIEYNSKSGSVFPLNFDYLGTVASAAIDSTSWTASPVISVANVLDNSSSLGTQSADFTALSGESFSQDYVVFRLTPTQYAADFQNHQYNFSSTLSDTRLVLNTIPEPSRAHLLLVGVFGVAVRRRR